MVDQQPEYDNLLLRPFYKETNCPAICLFFLIRGAVFYVFFLCFKIEKKKRRRKKAICSRHRFRCSHLKVLEGKIGQQNCTHDERTNCMTKPCLRFHTQLRRSYCLHSITTRNFLGFFFRCEFRSDFLQSYSRGAAKRFLFGIGKTARAKLWYL